jgi:two-component system LytT family response regulator
MNRLSVIIIDDEMAGRKTLRVFLERYCPEVEVIAEADSVKDAIDKIRSLRPQLIFLDINMPEENGLALFRHFQKNEFYTIFVTAHDEYALQAIKHQALDYILKPISIDELVAAVDRAKALVANQQARPEVSELPAPVEKNPISDKLALPILDGFVYVAIGDIIRCEAEGNYTRFVLSNGKKLLVSKTLGTYESRLKSSGFVRVHHHHLINIAHIEKYQRGRGGIVVMSDKSEVTVSQRRKDELLKKLNLEESN